MLHTACMLRTEDDLWKRFFFFHHVSCSNQTQVVRLTNILTLCHVTVPCHWLPYQLSHFIQFSSVCLFSCFLRIHSGICVFLIYLFVCLFVCFLPLSKTGSHCASLAEHELMEICLLCLPSAGVKECTAIPSIFEYTCSQFLSSLGFHVILSYCRPLLRD